MGTTYSRPICYSCNNVQLPRFNSRHWSLGRETIDAFTSHWGGENNWWCPPISLVPRVIRHARACGAKGTLVVPCWFSTTFWPMLCPDSNFFVVDVWELHVPRIQHLFLPGLSGAVFLMGSCLIHQCLLSDVIFPPGMQQHYAWGVSRVAITQK